MRNEIKLTGQKMIDIIPANFIDRIKESFQDFDLDYDQDLKDCCVLLNPNKGSCFLKHNYLNEFKTGTLIACFNEDGTGFYYPHHSRIWDNKKLIEEEKQNMINKKPRQK